MTTFSQQVDKAWSKISPIGKTTTTYIQRIMGIGYNRAVKITTELEGLGIISPAEGIKPRVVLKPFKKDDVDSTTN